jgi:hypothetical protein
MKCGPHLGIAPPHPVLVEPSVLWIEAAAAPD